MSVETTDLLSTLRREDVPILIDSIGGFVMESNREHKEWLAKIDSLMSFKNKAQPLSLESK